MVKINSTILRTIKDDATGATTSIRLFGKTFGELKDTISSIKTNGLFKSYVINDSDVKCIEKYNTLIDGGIPHLEAMEQASQGASDATKQMIKNANGNTIALNKMTLGAKAASVAMNVLSTVGNMVLITMLTKGVEWLVTYNQRLEESRQEMIETGKEVAQLTEDLDGLIEQYRKLGEDGAFDNSDREQAYNIQQQINELLGDEVEYINLQNGEYEEQLELLKKLQYEKSKDNYASFKDAKDAAEESLTSKAKGNINAGLVTTSSEIKAIEKLLKDNDMSKYLGGQEEGKGYSSFTIDTSSTEAIIQSYEDMVELKNILAKSYDNEIAKGGQLEDFYDSLTKKIDDMSDAVQKYQDAMSDYNINEAVIQFNEESFDGIKGAFIDSENAMSKWITSMIASKNVSDGVQTELISLAKTWYPQYIEQINNAINAEAQKIIQDTLADKSLSGNVESLKAQATVLGLTESAMISLVLAEINFNKNNLNVSQKVSALKELATWAGVAQAKMNSIFTANSKSSMKDKTTWANANNVTINKYADKDGTHTYTYNGKTYSGVNAVNEALLNDAIQSQIDKMNTIKVSPATVTSSGGGGSSSSSSSTKEVKETFDWIEIAISRLQYAISSFGKTVSATWKSWTDRNSALKSQISAVTSEINLQQQAANKYLSLANGVSLSGTYKELVRNGSLNISTITDENTIDAIKKYQEYYEAYLSALDAKQDAEDELASLVREDFDLIAKQFDSEISLAEANISTLEAYIDQTEMKGNLVSKNYYSAMYKEEEKNLGFLRQKYEQLSNKLSNGTIKQGSEEFNEMATEIKEVSKAIVESNTALEEYQKTMRELDWEVFDLIQDKISNVVDESNDWIELLSNSKLFNDDGSITSQGQATLGLYVANLRVYENQVNDYAKAIKDLDTQFADDSLDKYYLERREELLELQRESILNCESEKGAIKDLMNEGYNSLLSYMDELISKRKELLSQASDTRSFQKSIQEQTSEISRLQNILNSYNGDLSEEVKAYIQKYEVELKEAESNLEDTLYERYISDQEQMLDTLADDTEQWINTRLDNIDGLIQDVVTSVDENATSIEETLKTEVSKVGGILSTEMQNIWSSNDNLTSITDGVNNTLLDIKNLVAKLIDTSVVDTSTLTQTQGWNQNSDGTWNYRNASGENVTGWHKLDWNGKQDWYSFDENGTMRSNQWIKNDSGTWSYVNGSGAAVTGWQNLNWQGKNDWYAFDEEGNMKANQWVGDYFVGAGGQMLTDTWVGHDGMYYYVGSDGKWLNLPTWTSNGRPNDGYPIYEYAKGSKHIPFEQLALLGEAGQELKYDKDKGTLSLVGEGDMVWTNEQTKRLWELSKNLNPVMPNVQMPNLDFDKIKPNISNTDIGDITFDIKMYGVNNPQEMAQQVKKIYQDNIGNVRQTIRADVYGGMLNKNSLTRHKY